MRGEISVDNFSCDHFLVGWENDEFIRSEITLEEGISDENVDEHDWDEKELEKVFGEALPLYYCFREGTGNVESTEFWEVLSSLIPEIKPSSFYHTPAGTMTGWGQICILLKTLIRLKNVLKCC